MFMSNLSAYTDETLHNAALYPGPTPTEDVASLILRVLGSAPDRSAVAKNPNAYFAAKAVDDPPTNLAMLYMYLSDPGIPIMQSQYDSFAVITS